MADANAVPAAHKPVFKHAKRKGTPLAQLLGKKFREEGQFAPGSAPTGSGRNARGTDPKPWRLSSPATGARDQGLGALTVQASAGAERPKGPTLQVNSRPDFRRPVHVHAAWPFGEQWTLSTVTLASARSRARRRRRAPPRTSFRTGREQQRRRQNASASAGNSEHRHVSQRTSHLLALTDRVVTGTNQRRRSSRRWGAGQSRSSICPSAGD